jgi:cold shock protein
VLLRATACAAHHFFFVRDLFMSEQEHSQAGQEQMQTGTVKWFNESKGFGFIAQDAGGADVFAHFRDIQGGGFRTLQENQRVEFEVKQTDKGLQATNIRPM